MGKLPALHTRKRAGRVISIYSIHARQAAGRQSDALSDDADALELAGALMRAELGHMIGGARALRLERSAANLERAQVSISKEVAALAQDMRRDAETLRDEAGEDYLG